MDWPGSTRLLFSNVNWSGGSPRVDLFSQCSANVVQYTQTKQISYSQTHCVMVQRTHTIHQNMAHSTTHWCLTWKTLSPILRWYSSGVTSMVLSITTETLHSPSCLITTTEVQYHENSHAIVTTHSHNSSSAEMHMQVYTCTTSAVLDICYVFLYSVHHVTLLWLVWAEQRFCLCSKRCIDLPCCMP